MHRGYLKLWRKVEDSGLLQIPLTYALFTFLLLKATHKPRKIGTPHGVVDLQRGEYLSGRIALARDLNQSEQSIRTGLDRLQKMEILTITSTSRYSIYTIVNYGNYQDDNQDATSTDPTDNQHPTNGQPTDNQHPTTKQTHKHNKNEKNVKKETGPAFALPDWIDKDTWELWLKTRKGKKMIPEQMQAQVNKLAKWRDAGLDHAKALSDAATAGWQGLFEPPPKINGKSSSLPWWSTNELMLEKGRELGTAPRPGEDWMQFKSRLSAMVGTN